MKKIILAAAFAGLMLGANAQNVIERPTAADNWQIGIDGGVTTPLRGAPFFKSMRPQVGVHVATQLTPIFGVGVEGAWGINTTKSKNVFDTQYVGAYGTVNLFNLFGGFQCEPRKFWIDAVLGIGWIHEYYPKAKDYNAIGAKTGLAFNFPVTENFSISLKPDILWSIARDGYRTQFNSHRANFELMVGFNYNINPGFRCVDVPADNSAEIAALNDKVNALRGDLEGTAAALAATTDENAALAAALAAAQNQQPQVVQDTTLNSVRYVFFKVGSSVITADQMPNVEMVAQYMKNHPESKVVIKGYASPEGNLDFNIKLAKNRAESVKNQLVKRYKVAADRITAEGEGIGHMFSEESWNRVAICTLETK